MKRYVFMISDGTGITAENLGASLLSQFEGLPFEKRTEPYIDRPEKAEKIVEEINQCFEKTNLLPLLFMTVVNADIANLLKKANAKTFDFFGTFLKPLEETLETKSSHTVGKTHGVSDKRSYSHRIEAVDYALLHDDGIQVRNYDKADIVLVGVSRSGKTPSCLYMALHFGILAANYPFSDEELATGKLPDSLRPYQKKLFGLTINPERLQHIRTERRPGSTYASLEQCRREVAEAEALYRREKIPFLNSTRYSIEEISTKMLAMAGIKR